MPGFTDSEPPILRGDERTAKILVAGHFAAGKTTLVHGLSQIPPVSTEEVMTSVGADLDHTDLPAKTTTTVAMDFGRLHLADDLVLYLFGAPGQPRFFNILTDLARGALGALVLTDTRRLDETYPILERVEQLHLPYTVAVNAFDGAPTYPESRLREVMALDDTTPLVTCDARDRNSTRNALIVLVRHLVTLNSEPSR
ncbi:GTP-binding protein [Streptomyces lavendulae]|uniref:GTP-binding protein n=1 Tax=Streptomyces lavendulae TaxID=1914 RepID=UPI0024A10192|nr:ATP/GTP-binding protein [Streptomyces lavendulae]GLX22517.1 ATP/GTP-binding protein [Streptomyces lavendulae subsp. lavendulae]GLX30000.1 ATP/GTP-binding protein [Streptomyces lavendulae subsp. lavendulae]